MEKGVAVCLRVLLIHIFIDYYYYFLYNDYIICVYLSFVVVWWGGEGYAAVCRVLGGRTWSFLGQC